MVFISYAREDADAATRVMRALHARAVAVSRDPVLAQSAPFWREQVQDMLSACAALIAIDSPAARASPWVEQERRAFDGPLISVSSGGEILAWPAQLDLSSWPRLAAWLQGLARGRPAATPVVNDGDAVSRAAILQDQQEWLERFRSRHAASHARVRRSGPEYVNHADGSRVRPITPDAQTLLATMPVTNQQYAAFVAACGVREPPTWKRRAYRHAQAPVTGVTWFEASAYAAWVGGALPSEAEWTLAASAGQTHAIYATMSGAIGPDEAYYAQPFATSVPVPVTRYAPNPGGFFGMCGNTWDWVDGAWHAHRVIKGGGCTDAARFCRIDARYRNAAIDRDCCVGFRIRVTQPEVCN